MIKKQTVQTGRKKILSNQINQKHDIIESLLSALHASEGTTPAPSFAQTGLAIKKFMDQMPGGFFIYRADEEEQIIYANKAMLRIFNCDTMEEFRGLTGNSFRGVVHPEDLEEVEKSIWKQIAESHHDLDYVEYRIIQKGGQIRWIEDYGHFVRSEYAGDIFYVFIGDATEKKERQEAEHAQRLEVIEGLSIDYESILYANLDTDMILPYRLSSRTGHMFRKIYQSSRYGRFFSEYIAAWVHREDQSIIAHAMEPAQVRQRLSDSRTFYINFRTTENNEIQYLQLRIARVGNEKRISRIVLGARRVDDEIKYEMEQKKIFEDAWNQARLANITKSTFLSNMSHDMRTPLNAITGYTVLARNHIHDPEKILDYLEKIDASGEHLLRLVNHILEISRLESGTVEVVESEYRIRTVLEELEKNILPRAKSKGITFRTDLSALTHDAVYCDGEKIVQILIYLCGNAVKYTENNGHVLLTVSEKEETAAEYAVYRFSVKDDGIGIDEKHFNSIFEPFERVSNTTSCGVYGTGLGLTLAKNLVEMMSGRIEVNSTPGLGSEFTVTLRLRLCQDQQITYEKAQNMIKTLLKQKQILLVDDNELNLEIETELLQEIGLSVDCARNGQEAVDKVVHAPSGAYALILMDIQMPVMDGYDATRTIRRLPDPVRSHIPIIALSANTFDEDRRKSMESGMNAHIAKPLDMSAFLRLIVSIIQ